MRNKIFGKRTVFMPYVCCGDPSEDFTMDLIRTLAATGADAIELGIPFSDPIADGKSIQAASNRALKNGMTTDKAVKCIAKLRKEGLQLPIFVMTYYNIVYSRGIERFVSEINGAGADGLIVPDITIDESEELQEICKKHDIDLIYFITPNTSVERLGKIAERANGFIYAVSVLGTTGTREIVADDAIRLIKTAKKITKKPIVAGFGISDEKQAKAFSDAGANGVIIGSKIVEIYSKNLNDAAKACKEIGEFTRRIKQALEGGE
jgi:tryptophan synthase alpha chain